jgi:hypothetical protein
MFQCGASGRSLLESGRVELSRSDARGNQQLDGKDTCPDVRELSAWFRGSARPDDINTLSERGPHKPYK